MRHHRLAITILGLAIMILGTTTGSAGTRRTSSGRMLPQAVHGAAFAALQPLGSATGWGRVTVRDDDLPNGFHRTVQVWIFGMEPRTEYRIAIDDLEIGTIATRQSGSGVLKLQSRGGGHGQVPDDLPAVDLLQTAVVLDGSGAAVLEGDFSSFTRPEGETLYEEEIVLDDVTGGDASGMAKVEMKDGGHEEFKTHATGLSPGAAYSVRVDGLIIAVVTADDQGQARVQFEEPDDENPLPPELHPVSKIVLVEWLDSMDEILLSGSFSGAGNCRDLVGSVTAIDGDDFTIETGDGPVEIATTETTQWEGFDDHELTIGDMVKVEGCWDGDGFAAYEVELKNSGGGDCTKLVGIIGDVSGTNFILETNRGQVQVVTTHDTEWENFDDRDPATGDRVKVDGCWDGDVFYALEVELLKDDSGGKCSTYVGNVSALDGSDFVIRNGNRLIAVATTEQTVWEEFGDHQLAVGDKVKITGCWENDVFIAATVELKKPA